MVNKKMKEEYKAFTTHILWSVYGAIIFIVGLAKIPEQYGFEETVNWYLMIFGALAFVFSHLSYAEKVKKF